MGKKLYDEGLGDMISYPSTRKPRSALHPISLEIER